MLNTYGKNSGTLIMIVWLASYPRSGNTFIRILLKQFFGLQSSSVYNDAKDIAANENLSALVGHKPHTEDQDSLQDTDEINLVKTHDHPIDDNKAIYLVRDPRAVITSYRYYLEQFGNFEFKPLEVAVGAVGFGSWGDHLRAWAPKQRANTLLLHYEDICSDPKLAVEKIGIFLNRTPNEGVIPTFEDLQKVDEKFFRSGSNERNKQELSADIINVIDSLFAEEMDLFQYQPVNQIDKTAALDTLRSLPAVLWGERRAQRRAENRAKTYHNVLQETQATRDVFRQERDQARKEKKAYATDLDKKSIAFDTAQIEILKHLSAATGVKKSLVEQIQKTTEQSKKVEHKTKEIIQKDLQVAEQKNLIQTADAKILKMADSAAEQAAERVELNLNATRMADRLSLMQRELADAQHEISSITAGYQLLREHLARTQAWTSPRLKSILTLKPLRFVLHQRQGIKSGELIADEDGLIIPARITVPNEQSSRDLPIDTFAPAQSIEFKGPNSHTHSSYAEYVPKKPLGIALFAFDRIRSVQNVLESLKLQDALEHTHIWIDGDQGRHAMRKTLDDTFDLASRYDVAAIHRNRGNFGFRKMMLISLRKMFEEYEHVLFLEDDCFPTRQVLKGFSKELEGIDTRDDIFSVYGHPFLVPGEDNDLGRFQGWGWATTRAKMNLIWDELIACYMMSEEEYLAFTKEKLTPEIRNIIDVTPGRDPSKTLSKFFAWDETLCLLTAMKGLKHRRTAERLIYNFGLGDGSTHFGNFAHYREPPFNMVSVEEIWNYY